MNAMTHWTQEDERAVEVELRVHDDALHVYLCELLEAVASVMNSRSTRHLLDGPLRGHHDISEDEMDATEIYVRADGHTLVIEVDTRTDDGVRSSVVHGCVLQDTRWCGTESHCITLSEAEAIIADGETWMRREREQVSASAATYERVILGLSPVAMARLAADDIHEVTLMALVEWADGAAAVELMRQGQMSRSDIFSMIARTVRLDEVLDEAAEWLLRSHHHVALLNLLDALRTQEEGYRRLLGMVMPELPDLPVEFSFRAASAVLRAAGNPK